MLCNIYIRILYICVLCLIIFKNTLLEKMCFNNNKKIFFNKIC